jgi:tape measure domain-containing protein
MAGTVNLKSKISLDDSAFVSGIKRVQRTVGAFAGKASRAFRSVGASIAKAVTRLKNFAAIIAKISLVGIGAGIAAAGVAVSKLVKAGSGMAAQYETIRLTMGAYLKDLSHADTILNQIAKFSVVTPFETTGLQDATNTLLGAGIAGEEVVGVLKEIAAVSKTTGQVGELADALSKGFAKGKFQTEELNKFLERGINLMPELERVTGKSGEALQKAIQKGLKFDDVRTAIANLSKEGGLFFGMLETQSTTFTGLISTLSSNWDEFLLKFGQPINDSLKPLLDIFIVQVQKLTQSGAQIGTVISTAIDGVVNKIKGVDFVGIGQKFIAGLDVNGAKTLLMSAAKVVAAFLGNKMVEAIRLSASLFEVAFLHVSAKITGKFGDQLIKAAKDAAEIMFFITTGKIGQAMAKIQIATGKTMGEQAKTLEDKMMAAQKAFKDKITKDDDPFGFKKAAEDLDNAMSDIMAKGKDKIASRSESDEYDAELAAQKARVKRDEEMPKAAKAQKAADQAKINDFLTGAVPDHVSANMPLKVDPRGQSAFQKLQSSTSAFDLLQGRKAQGIAVGASTSLSQNGMGVKRYTNPAREAARIAKEQKKNVRDQTDILRDVDKKLAQGLAVN